MSTLKKLVSELEKKFGKNVVRKASDIQERSMDRVSTGVIPLDVAIGGGYPVGRFIQLAGHESASKSTLAYHAIREFQDYFKKIGEDKLCVIIQGEQGSYTNEYGDTIGIDNDNLIVNDSASMEEAFEVAVQLQRSELVGLIVIDSITSFPPEVEYESDMDKNIQMGIKPKLIGEYCRKFQSANNRLMREDKMPCTVIALNQIREKIGVMYGNPEYSPGGRELRHTSSLTINLRRGELIKLGKDSIIGQEVHFKINKSKVSPQFVSGFWDFYFEDGGPIPKGHVDNFKAIVIEAVLAEIVDKSGAWLSYEDIKLQGIDKFVDYLRNHLEIYEEIRGKLLSRSREDILSREEKLVGDSKEFIEETVQVEEEEEKETRKRPRRKK